VTKQERLAKSKGKGQGDQGGAKSKGKGKGKGKAWKGKGKGKGKVDEPFAALLATQLTQESSFCVFDTPKALETFKQHQDNMNADAVSKILTDMFQETAQAYATVDGMDEVLGGLRALLPKSAVVGIWWNPADGVRLVVKGKRAANSMTEAARVVQMVEGVMVTLGGPVFCPYSTFGRPTLQKALTEGEVALVVKACKAKLDGGMPMKEALEFVELQDAVADQARPIWGRWGEGKKSEASTSDVASTSGSAASSGKTS
jgi:hypothetical protein